MAAREAAARRRVAEAHAEIRALATALDLTVADPAGEDDWAGEAGAPAGADFDALVEAVARRAAERRRLETLEGELLPGATRRLLEEDARAALIAERERLSAEGAASGDKSAPADPATPPATDASALERELEAARRGLIELHARVGARDVQNARKLGDLLSDREGKLQALARARDFKAAVELARDRFQVVARETHARWSEHLSGRVDELLAGFGLPHAGFRLSDKLEPSLALAGERLTGARLDQVLSTGARDQVVLALRLAICEFLARGGEKLPLLLDDPLAHADDARGARLLRALGEVARSGHQVFVLTCHRATVEALEAEDPQWFGEQVTRLEFDPAAAGRPL
jgi:DNA repair exonuclease SbcCD ATPase subunit